MLYRIPPLSIEVGEFLDEVLCHWNPNSVAGWHFGSGDPENWKYSDKLLIPNGRLLDIGIGSGRSSLFFALNGMAVVGYDTSDVNLSALESLASELSLPIDLRCEDILTADIGGQKYNTVLMTDVFTHYQSHSLAYLTIQKAIEALKPGGHLSLRVFGWLDSTYAELKTSINSFVESEYCILAPCGCSGEYRIEPHLFFGQTEVMQFLLRRGMKIIHSQLMPTVGRMNVMYGEDWQTESFPTESRAAISIIAQKPY